MRKVNEGKVSMEEKADWEKARDWLNQSTVTKMSAKVRIENLVIVSLTSLSLLFYSTK